MKQYTNQHFKFKSQSTYKLDWRCKYFLFAFVLLNALSSCKKDFLDQKTLTVLDEKAIFSDSTYSWQYVNSRYLNVSMSWDPNRFTTGGLETSCDEAEPAISPTSYNTLIVTGAANPSNTDKTVWTTVYQQVRAINIFLKNENNIPVSVATRKFWDGQVRFLRAWYYALMIKHYGGFPIVGNTIYEQSDKIDLPRSNYEQCVNYIITECDAVAASLPVSYPIGNLDYGRATKGAALGLKARVLLYAASPLTNASRSDDPDHLVSYGNLDKNRWKLAADACQAVINLGQYSLYRASSPASYQTFLVQYNNEQLFVYENPSNTGNDRYREAITNPPSRNPGGYLSLFPYQEFVDAFGMQNGLPITDPASGYTGIGDNMYQNRDPRLSYSVQYNGSSRFLNGYSTDQPVNIYTGVIPTGNSSQTSASLDGIYKVGATTTGYYSYKMCADNVASGGSVLTRPKMLMRYAEILLSAAEAYNEYSGPSTQIYSWLTDIRDRAGITPGTNNLYGIKAGMTQDEMRNFIQNERQVELAFEEQRFWDVRRWKIAPVTENRDFHGMEITRAANGSFSYRTIVIKKHVFRDNMYFWPIPQSELTKSAALKQNPGY